MCEHIKSHMSKKQKQKKKIKSQNVNHGKARMQFLLSLRVCLDRTYFAETENLLLKSL